MPRMVGSMQLACWYGVFLYVSMVGLYVAWYGAMLRFKDGFLRYPVVWEVAMMVCYKCLEGGGGIVWYGGLLVRNKVQGQWTLAVLSCVAMLVRVAVQIYVYCKCADEIGLPLFKDACVVLCLVSLCGGLCSVLLFCVFFVWI